jgi:uncharacterized protein (TIGR00730 family)
MEGITKQSGRIAAFCGARVGAHPGYLEFATGFGTSLAVRGFDLVYGGGGAGVMGAVADAVLAAGGGVIGVTPYHLPGWERPAGARGTLFVVRSMHERKALMYRLSAGFAVLPGGIGTMDELMEVATWNKLGIIDKPVVVLNYRGFFDPMLAMLDHFVAEGFLGERERSSIQIAYDAEEAFARLARSKVPAPVVGSTPGDAA